MKTPPTDIVIPVHDALDYFKQCITSLYANTPSLFRLIVVDDFSRGDTKQYLLDLLNQKKINTLVHTNRQRWFTRASNLGLRMVNTDWAVLLNSDCTPMQGWLEELYRVKEETGNTTALIGSVHTPGASSSWVEVSKPNYVTGHCWFINMPFARTIADRRGTPGRILDETKAEAIHINSDRFLSYSFNESGWKTIVSYRSAVAHANGKSWGHVLSSIPEKLQEVDVI